MVALDLSKYGAGAAAGSGGVSDLKYRIAAINAMMNEKRKVPKSPDERQEETVEILCKQNETNKALGPYGTGWQLNFGTYDGTLARSNIIKGPAWGRNESYEDELARCPYERKLLQDALKGPEVGPGWRWIRENPAAWRFRENALEMALRPGGLWGKVFADFPGPMFLLRAVEDGWNALEVTVEMPSPGKAGEQAGMFWYIDDDNYAKLVVERGENNTAKIVFAQEGNADPRICGTEIKLVRNEVSKPIRLRLEVSVGGSQLTGSMVEKYWYRLAGMCLIACKGWNSRSPSLGLSAHGGTAGTADRFVKFTNFTTIGVKKSRVQWNPDMLTAAAKNMSVNDGVINPEEVLSGWILSPTLTEDDRSQFANMISKGGVGKDSGYDGSKWQDSDRDPNGPPHEMSALKLHANREYVIASLFASTLFVLTSMGLKKFCSFQKHLQGPGSQEPLMLA